MSSLWKKSQTTDCKWSDAALNTLLVCREVDTIRKLHGEDSLNEELRFILQLYLSGVSKMTIEWIMDERTDIKPEVFTDRIMEAMPEKIRALLLP